MGCIYRKLGDDDVQIGDKDLEEGWSLVTMNKIYRVIAVRPMFSNQKMTSTIVKLNIDESKVIRHV